MSSTEIEDVLSSIRRLVSEDMRPVQRSAAPVAVETGKLILTPALRVVQDNSAVIRPVAVEPVAVEPVAVHAAPVEPAPVAATQPEAEPALFEALAPPPRLPVFVATRRVQILPVDEAPFIEVEPPPIEQVVASLGAAVTASPEDWEPEHGDGSLESEFADAAWVMPQAEFFHNPQPWTIEPVETAAAAEPAAMADPGMAESGPVVLEVPAWAQSDDPTVAEEPDEIVLQATIEPDADWADAAEASVIAALQAEADDVQARQSQDAAGEADSEMRFNEDVLRELVRDILREELAGGMGERITRNIRKLVRSEIATILAAQGLE